jgi:hypothetical protein
LWWYRTMLIFCDIVVAILKMATGRNCSMSGINSRHHNVPTYEMALKSDKPFHMWVDYDVSNWFLTLNNFYRSPFSKWPPQYRKKSTLSDIMWWPFWKWRPVEIVQCRESIRDIIIYPHIKFWWYRNDVPNWFLTSKNFYRPPFSKWPPQYCTNSTLFDFNAISYVGRLWCPELIPDIEKFLPAAIFKMHMWNVIEIKQCWICAVLWWPFWKWRPVEIFHFQNGCQNMA